LSGECLRQRRMNTDTFVAILHINIMYVIVISVHVETIGCSTMLKVSLSEITLSVFDSHMRCNDFHVMGNIVVSCPYRH
jgi:hypothetical protein